MSNTRVDGVDQLKRYCMPPLLFKILVNAGLWHVNQQSTLHLLSLKSSGYSVDATIQLFLTTGTLGFLNMLGAEMSIMGHTVSACVNTKEAEFRTEHRRSQRW